MTQAAILAASGSPGTTTGFKNRLINGGMYVNQYNAGTIAAADGTFAIDRWRSWQATGSGSKGNQAVNLNSVTPPAGFTNYLGFQTTSQYSVSGTDSYAFQYRPEGLFMTDLAWGTSNAKTVTLSFYVYSSLTGTFGGAFRDVGATASYPFTYTISSANTWTKISITVPGPTIGTWGSSTSVWGYLSFSYGTGPDSSGPANAWAANGAYWSATGATSVVGTNGATFYITGAQLEIGSTATNFDVRPYATELALCQRYFWQLGNGVSTNLAYYFSQPGNAPSGGGGMPILFSNPVPMRTAPDVSFNISSSNYTGSTPSGTQWQLIAPNIDICSLSGSTIQLFGTSSITASGVQTLYANISRQPSLIVFGSTAYIKFSSEL